jgi:hypothetical protein
VAGSREPYTDAHGCCAASATTSASVCMCRSKPLRDPDATPEVCVIRSRSVTGCPLNSGRYFPTGSLIERRPSSTSVMIVAQVIGFEPGSKWSYSNNGIATLGRVLEVVYDKPYEQVVDEKIFQPLGMHDTSFGYRKRESTGWLRYIPTTTEL